MKINHETYNTLIGQFDETVISNILSDITQGCGKFKLFLNGKVFYGIMLLCVDKFDLTSKKAKSDETAGTFVTATRNGTLDTIVTKALLSNGRIGVLPTQKSLTFLDEYSAFRQGKVFKFGVFPMDNLEDDESLDIYEFEQSELNIEDVQNFAIKNTGDLSTLCNTKDYLKILQDAYFPSNIEQNESSTSDVIENSTPEIIHDEVQEDIDVDTPNPFQDNEDDKLEDNEELEVNEKLEVNDDEDEDDKLEDNDDEDEDEDDKLEDNGELEVNEELEVNDDEDNKLKDNQDVQKETVNDESSDNIDDTTKNEIGSIPDDEDMEHFEVSKDAKFVLYGEQGISIPLYPNDFEFVFLNDYKPFLFDTNRPESFVNTLINEKCKDFNNIITNERNKKIKELKFKFIKLINEDLQKKSVEYDFTNEQSPFYEKYQVMHKSYLAGQQKLAEEIEQQTAQIEKEFNDSLESLIQNTIEKTKAEYIKRHSITKDSKIKRMKTDMEIEAENEYNGFKRELREAVQNMAQKDAGEFRLTALEVLKADFDKYLEYEKKLIEDYKNELDKIREENKENEMVRINVQEKELREREASQEVERKFLAKMENMKTDYEQMFAKYEKSYEALKQSAEMDLRQRDFDYANAITKVSEENTKLRNELDYYVNEIGKIKAEYDRNYNDEIHLLKSQNIDIKAQLNAEKSSSKVKLTFAYIASFISVIVGLSGLLLNFVK